MNAIGRLAPAGRRVLVVQPSIAPPGGGNAVAAWMIEALADHELTLLTFDPPDLAAIDRQVGTSLAGCRLETMLAPRWMRSLRRLLPFPGALVSNALLARAARRIAGDYEVVVTANNESDFGVPVIQYVHYPWLLRPRPSHDLRWYHRFPALLRAYYWWSDRLYGFRPERMRDNLTFANSAWTAERIRKLHGIDSRILYPPVHLEAPDVPWEERATSFVCLGRLSPEKRYETVIEILSSVRRSFPEIRLEIVGSPDHRAYGRSILDRVARHRSWVTLTSGPSRADLGRILTRHRYGIHAMPEEHFGMAVGEMVAAGCIVFVPGEGGQSEIVGGEPALLWRTPAEAAERIASVLASAAEQERLRGHLRKRVALFSVGRFLAAMREIVREPSSEGRAAC